MWADFVAIDMNHSSLSGWTPNDFLDVLFFGSSSAAIKQVWVEGRIVWS
jgi:cytosine/adenosine deaminase-related metal-dependent hydrolase